MNFLQSLFGKKTQKIAPEKVIPTTNTLTVSPNFHKRNKEIIIRGLEKNSPSYTISVTDSIQQTAIRNFFQLASLNKESQNAFNFKVIVADYSFYINSSTEDILACLNPETNFLIKKRLKEINKFSSEVPEEDNDIIELPDGLLTDEVGRHVGVSQFFCDY